MPTIDVTYNDGSSERIQHVTDWDVHESGRLIMWNAAGDLVGERTDVATAVYD